MSKRPSVVITNPSASRLPRKRGAFNPRPAGPEPIRPKLPPKHTQMAPGPTVLYTTPKESAESLRGKS